MKRRDKRSEMFIYIEKMIDELEKMEKKEKNKMMVYLLEMEKEEERE